MDVFEAIERRRSVRAYLNKPVPEDVLMKILEAGRLAPSAKNLQPWHFVVVTDSKKREVLSRGRWAKFLKDCPVAIVGCGDEELSPRWHAVDVSIAMQQMVLAATAEGLGTCWIGSFDEAEVKGCLGIPEHQRVVAMLALGYPKDGPGIAARILGARRRRPLDDVVSWESFGAKKA